MFECRHSSCMRSDQAWRAIFWILFIYLLEPRKRSTKISRRDLTTAYGSSRLYRRQQYFPLQQTENTRKSTCEFAGRPEVLNSSELFRGHDIIGGANEKRVCSYFKGLNQSIIPSKNCRSTKHKMK